MNDSLGRQRLASLSLLPDSKVLIYTFHTVFFISGADYIHANQIRDKEKLKASETKKRLRDLSVIMSIKKDLIKELVKTGVSIISMVCNVFVVFVLCVFCFFFSDRE